MYFTQIYMYFLFRDMTHVDWTKAWLATLTEVQAYIKQYHTIGIKWNAQVGR